MDLMWIGIRAACGRKLVLHAALVLSLMVIQKICTAQAVSTVRDRPPIPTATPTPTPAQSQNDSAQTQAPLTERERAMLELIKNLQERVAKLEAGQAAPSPAPLAAPSPTPLEAMTDASESQDPYVELEPVVKEKPKSEAGNRESYGRYTPNLGYKVANTEYGDLSISIYTYARYLNQRALRSSYTDAFDNTKSIQKRQDFQLQKVQVKLLGWILDPRLRYFIYTWTSNPTQGQGAQVVVAGNLNYTFNKYVTLSAGITSLPGVRSTEGNFPFWLSVDSRLIADEFFRPSYTSGVWLRGNITKTLRYQAMIANNLSTLGVSAARLDNKFNTFSSALVWTPTG
jgi:hypothetical protein